jgi:hypothetical protein
LFLNELTNRKFPDYQLEIDDTQSALFAIDFITSQGEGVSPQAPHFEVSHFQRLRRIARSVAQLGEQQWQRNAHDPPFCPAYPAIKNPTLDPKPGMNTITNPTARQTMALFAGSFEVMLSLMAHHFAQGPSHSLRRSRLMNAAIDVMTGVMRPLANRLMTLPSGISGKTAGPYYGLPQLPTQAADYGAGCLAVADKCAALARQAEALDSAVPPVVLGMLHWVQEHLEGLATGRITREA